MEFVLNDYKAELSDEEILEDIKQVASKLNVDYISVSTYKKHGKYSQCAIQNHFGTWKNALCLAGLRNERNSSELKFISDADYVQDVKRVAEIINSDTVKYSDYQKYGKYSGEHIFKRFSNWDAFLTNAGLKPTGLSKKKITEQELFDEIERIWILLGRQPTSTDIIKHNVSKYSIDTYKRRFGGWRKTLEAFVTYINSENRENLYEATIDETITSDENMSDTTENQKLTNSNKNETIFKHQTPRNINTRLRFKVLQRDHFKCCACGTSPAKNPAVELQVDHIVAWANGGETVLDNLQTLCSVCNNGKSNVL